MSKVEFSTFLSKKYIDFYYVIPKRKFNLLLDIRKLFDFVNFTLTEACFIFFFSDQLGVYLFLVSSPLYSCRYTTFGYFTFFFKS